VPYVAASPPPYFRLLLDHRPQQQPDVAISKKKWEKAGRRAFEAAPSPSPPSLPT